ncbi:MAG: response regulator [Alicyclobacillus sp.]|nr:response regulator [Alicyclobacillus sp.]
MAIIYGLHPDVDVVGKARSIREALEICDQYPIDLVSVDINLHYENGFELCKQISKRYPKAFIAICSVHDVEVYRQPAAECGVRYFLSKPFTLQDVDKLVKIVCSEKYWSQRA